METLNTTQAGHINWKQIAFTSILKAQKDGRGSHAFEMHMYYKGLPHLIIVGESTEEVKQKADDYFNLIRCTYGANIDPEKIQEAVDCLEAIKKHADEWGLAAYLYDKLTLALNNIKRKE